MDKENSVKTALITGGIGFIGSALTNQLLKKKIVKRCIILDNFGSFINPLGSDFKDYRKERIEDNKNIVIERGDASNEYIILKLLQKYKPEIIYHTAALPLAKIENLNAKEASIGSVDATRNILECLTFVRNHNKKYNFRRFVYFSSSMVYGNFKNKIINEKSETNPKEIYGTMKLAGEIITRGMSSYYNIPFTIIRPSAVYGPKDMNHRVSEIFINKAIKGHNINIQGKNEKLDFTYIDDLVNGVILASIKPNGINHTFNITNGKGRTLFDFVKILSKYFPKIKYTFKDRDSFRPKRGTLSILKAIKLIGYKPKTSLEKGIYKYLIYLKILKN